MLIETRSLNLNFLFFPRLYKFENKYILYEEREREREREGGGEIVLINDNSFNPQQTFSYQRTIRY